MTEMISETPAYVWVLLGFLLAGGWKSRKIHVISWKLLLVMPSIMFLWSLYTMLTYHGSISFCLWAMSITMGIWLGSLTVRLLNLRFDKQKKLIEIGGQWTPMILSISIFSLRYFLGAIHGFYPELTKTPALLALENIATLVSGMFAGRLLGYWKRSKTIPHSDLAKT
jgi:hypothetical protein